MIEMTRCDKNRCIRYDPLPPPTCPPPPKKPFPWRYILPWIIFFTSMGAFYRYHLWKEERERLSDYKPIWRPRPKVKKPLFEQELPTCVQYLIVGGGAAAWAAYTTIARLHPNAKVFMISLEDIPPYIKPPLSKFMWWNKDPPDLKTLNYVEDSVKKTMYFTDCNNFMPTVKFIRLPTGPALSLATGWWVTRVDPEEHCAYVETLCGERPIYYERCLLATGSRPKNLKIFERANANIRRKVCTLSNVRDLEIAYRRVQASKHVTVIGGGILGSELAWTLAKRNQKIKEDDPEAQVPEVVHVIKDKGIVPAILPEYLGEWGADKIRAEGVNVISKAQVYDVFMDDDERLNLTLSNGNTIVTDYVFVAVGVEARTDIGKRSDLELDEENGGMVVNTELEARKHLFVAGDAASVYTAWKNTRMRFQHFANAWETGEIAGANMTGEWSASAVEPHFWFKLGPSINMEVIGEVGACMPTVGIFKQCDNNDDDDDETPAGQPKPVPVSANGDKPCLKRAAALNRNMYKRGMLFYIRNESVVGMTFWNIPPVEDRTRAVIEMLRARPTVQDINMLAELLGFPDTQCVYRKTADELAPPLCFTNLKEW